MKIDNLLIPPGVSQIYEEAMRSDVNNNSRNYYIHRLESIRDFCTQAITELNIQNTIKFVSKKINRRE